MIRNITSIDNREGFGSNINNKANEYSFETVDIQYIGNHIYGESEIPDCPQKGEGGYCFKFNKFGMMQAGGTWGGKDMHIGTMSPLPPNSVGAIGSIGTVVKLFNNTFYNFKSSTHQGMR